MTAVHFLWSHKMDGRGLRIPMGEYPWQMRVITKDSLRYQTWPRKSWGLTYFRENDHHFQGFFTITRSPKIPFGQLSKIQAVPDWMEDMGRLTVPHPSLLSHKKFDFVSTLKRCSVSNFVSILIVVCNAWRLGRPKLGLQDLAKTFNIQYYFSVKARIGTTWLQNNSTNSAYE